jgi:sodium/pantothenate symporter
MLLLLSAAIIKDLYIRYWLKNDLTRISSAKISRMSLGCTFIMGVLVFLAAFNPPELLVWINLFAFGGLEAVFLWPVILGMYWKKANATGAVWSILAGTGLFIALSVGKISPWGIHPIVPTLLFSLLCFIAGSYLGTPADKNIIELFWNDTPASTQKSEDESSTVI